MTDNNDSREKKEAAGRAIGRIIAHMPVRTQLAILDVLKPDIKENPEAEAAYERLLCALTMMEAAGIENISDLASYPHNIKPPGKH